MRRKLNLMTNKFINHINQFFLLKKYGKYNIPVKHKNNWYYKEAINYNGKIKNEIVKCDRNLMYHFEEYANCGLHYHYEYGIYKNLSKEKVKEFRDFIHAHELYYVLEDVYNYPESFFIPNESKVEYSNQEINWINELQKKCLKYGLKDIGYFTTPLCESHFIGQAYNIGELKKRNIKKLYGKSIKKYLKKQKNEDYLILNKEYKIEVI